MKQVLYKRLSSLVILNDKIKSIDAKLFENQRKITPLILIFHFFRFRLILYAFHHHHHHHHHHVVPLARISLTLSRHFSLSFIASAGLQGYIPYPHIAAESMFELVVLLLLAHMWGPIGVHHLWARPCFSSSVLHVWFV